MRNLSYENEFCMQFHFHANQSHFHKNDFALRLALKQRHKGTRKWPNKDTNYELTINWPALSQSQQSHFLSHNKINLVIVQFSWHDLVLITDAFGRVIFTHLVADTRVIWETRSPTWDQMLVFKDLILWGDVNEIAVNPPTIVIEVFDKDIGVSERFFPLPCVGNWS